MNFKLSEKILVFASAIVFALATYVSVKNIPIWKVLFISDFSELRHLVNNQPPVGKVKIIKGQLTRRQKESGSFSNVKEGQTLFHQDTLKTDGQSEAVIWLDNSGEITVAPNSMIQLNFEEKEDFAGMIKKPKIQVLSGEIKNKPEEIEKPQPVSLKEKLKVIKPPVQVVQKATPSKLQSIFKPVEPVREIAAKTEVVVVEKPVELPPPPVVKAPVLPEVVKTPPVALPKIPTKVVMKPIEALETSMPGGIQLQDNLLRNKQIEKFFILLKWEPVVGATDYRIEVMDEHLKPLFQDTTIDPVYKLFENQVFNGDILYRIHAYQGTKAIAESQVFKKTFNFLPPSLKVPQMDETVKNQVVFTWTKTNFTKSYVFEVGADEKFTRTIKKELSSNFHQLKLKPGTYFWRVSSKTGNVVSLPAPAQKFTVAP